MRLVDLKYQNRKFFVLPLGAVLFRPILQSQGHIMGHWFFLLSFLWPFTFKGSKVRESNNGDDR